MNAEVRTCFLSVYIQQQNQECSLLPLQPSRTSLMFQNDALVGVVVQKANSLSMKMFTFLFWSVSIMISEKSGALSIASYFHRVFLKKKKEGKKKAGVMSLQSTVQNTRSIFFFLLVELSFKVFFVGRYKTRNTLTRNVLLVPHPLPS